VQKFADLLHYWHYELHCLQTNVLSSKNPEGQEDIHVLLNKFLYVSLIIQVKQVDEEIPQVLHGGSQI